MTDVRLTPESARKKPNEDAAAALADYWQLISNSARLSRELFLSHSNHRTCVSPILHHPFACVVSKCCPTALAAGRPECRQAPDRPAPSGFFCCVHVPKRHTRRHATITCFPFPFLARSEKCFEFRLINNPLIFSLVTRHSTPLPGHLSTTVSSSIVHLCIIINKSSNPTESQHPIRLPGKSYSFSSNPQPTAPETPRSTARAFARASEGERGKTNE